MRDLGLERPPGAQSNGPALLAVTIVSFTFVVVSTFLRVIARLYLVRQFGVEDYLILLATSAVAVITAFTAKQIIEGGGRHEWDLTRGELAETSKWGNLLEAVIPLAALFTKLSICLFLTLRIPINKHLKRCIYVMMAVLIIINGGSFIILMAQCNPLNAWWRQPPIDSECWASNEPVFLAGVLQALYSILTDFICSGLAVAVLWSVRMSREKKLLTCGLMCLGLVATAFSIVRIVLYAKDQDQASAGPTPDMEYVWSFLEIWGVLEQNIATTAANLPFMPHIYKYVNENAPGAIIRIKIFFGVGDDHRASPPLDFAVQRQEKSSQYQPPDNDLRFARADDVCPISSERLSGLEDPWDGDRIV